MLGKCRTSLTLLLLVGVLSMSFLTIIPVEDADAWIRHGCCVKECTRGWGPFKITWCCESRVFWHLSPFYHSFSCP